MEDKFIITCRNRTIVGEFTVEPQPLPSYPGAFRVSRHDNVIGFVSKHSDGHYIQLNSIMLLMPDTLEMIGEQIELRNT